MTGIDVNALFDLAKEPSQFIPRSDPSAMYRGRELPRSKIYINDNGDDSLLLYRFPGMQYASMRHYKYLHQVPWMQQPFATVRSIEFNGRQHTFNQAIVTLYKNGGDNIGYHSDKMASIGDSSIIFDISLGATRTFHLRSNETGEVETVSMASGSAIAITTQTNAQYQHAVLAEPCASERVSIVFRNIRDSLTPAQVKAKIASAATAKGRRDEAKKRSREQATA